MKLEASADLDWSHTDSLQGRVCGGKYLESVADASTAEEEQRPLQKVEIDMPMTLTDSIIKDGKEYVVLEFAANDPEDPYNWSKTTKWIITVILCCFTMFIGLATTAYSAGIEKMVKELNTSVIIGQFGLFAFNEACAIAPLFLAPFCELVGRRVVYVGAYLCFSLCFIGLALGRNIGTILVLRAILGLFGSVGTILVGGTFDDIFKPQDRSYPMAMFTFAAIFSTVGAPIYAGFINMKIGWRWIEGIQGLSNIPVLIIAIFGLKETRGSVKLQKRAKKLRQETGDDRWMAKEELETPGLKEMLYNSSVKAGYMLATEPVVFFFGLWISFAWFITFLFLSVIPITFGTKKGWNEGMQGLPYIALGIGVALGYAAQFVQIWLYNRKNNQANGADIPPEYRLYGALFGSPFLPIGLFIYSFTQYEYLTWVAPCIGLGCISFGIWFVFEATYSFTSDCYGTSASSAIAGQGFMRNTLGAVSPLFAHQFFTNVGSQFAGLILACVASLLTLTPFILFKFGPKIRAKSKAAIVYNCDNVDQKNIDEKKRKQEGNSSSEVLDDKIKPTDTQVEGSSRNDSRVNDEKSKTKVEIF